MEKGLRLILTFACSQHCSFCYQANKRDDKTELGVDYASFIIKNMLHQGTKYDYITFMGGELTELPNLVEYVRVARSLFTGRINITSNGKASINDYQRLFDAGLSHLNLSSLDHFDEDLVVKLNELNQHGHSLRMNIFLPASHVTTPVMWSNARRYYAEAVKAAVQINLLYDYREKFKDYDEAVEKATSSALMVDNTLKTTTRGAHYLIMTNAHDYVSWVDINFKKNSEEIITPYGNVAHGFEYVEKEEF